MIIIKLRKNCINYLLVIIHEAQKNKPNYTAILFIINPVPRIIYPVPCITNEQFKQSNRIH